MDNDSDYLSAWVAIISRSPKSTTLKYALGKSFIEIARYDLTEGDFNIPKREIASRFIEYYWAQEFIYRFRQTTNPLGIPNVVKILRDVWQEPQKLKQKPKDTPEQHGLACDRIVKECFKEVIPRFHNIKGGSTTIRFFENSRGYITIPRQAGTFLRKHEAILTQNINYHWSLWLERINSTPRISSKVTAGFNPQRKSLSKYKKKLSFVQNSCFYCDCNLSETQSIHVDHFIPWSYIFEDSMWNLVLTCRECNLRKSDKLPSHEYLEKLFSRNSSLPEALSPEVRTEFERSFWSIPGYDQNVEEGIRGLYLGAKNDGVPILKL
jgi:hypothetical protein